MDTPRIGQALPRALPAANPAIPPAPTGTSDVVTLSTSNAATHDAPPPPRRVITFEFDSRDGPKLSNVGLKGSFDPCSGKFDPNWNGGQTIPMFDDGSHGDAVASDGVYTAQVALDPNDRSTFGWGVQGNVLGPDGKVTQVARWLIQTESPPSFTLQDQDSTIRYSLTGNHQMGLQRVGPDGFSFQTWSPAMGDGDLADYKLRVEVFAPDGTPRASFPMDKDKRTGVWSVMQPFGWHNLQGDGYRYVARNGQGQILQRHWADGSTSDVAYGDPYARFLQGPQRGLERLYVDPVLGIETGWYDSSDTGGPNYSINPQWARFSVAGHPQGDRVTLQLQDAQGHVLTRDELLARLGTPGLVPYDQATPQQKHNVDILRAWQINTSSPVETYKWLDHTEPDGTIELQRVGDDRVGTSWISAVNNYPALVGLRYQFQVYENGKLLGDTNGDGILQASEAKDTAFNEAFSNVISAHPGNERLSLVRASSYQFRFDTVPRKTSDFRKFRIYEAHPGSFFGSRDNERASDFSTLIKHLDYIEKRGFNTIELMPVQEFGGVRDWGYTPDFMFAGAEAYGFEMPRDQAVALKLIDASEQTDRPTVWIHGTDAFKLFVDEAHNRGINVLSDVVYNHVGGRPDAEGPLELIDGDHESFFRWNGQYDSQTPWGEKPNYGAQAVKDFYTANATQQLSEFHLDGARFDFVQVLHDTGSTQEKTEGMNTLRQINRTIRIMNPNTYTVAEDFTHDWLVAADLTQSQQEGDMTKRGMGFDGVWNDSFHHQLLGNIGGDNGYNMDTLMNAVTNHVGVAGWDHAVVFSHNHDEVGNSGKWVLRVAAHSVKEQDVLAPYPRAIGRSAAAITLTSAGVPMIWQGEEQLANNDFKHAMPSTWGLDLKWLDFQVTPDQLDGFKQIEGLPADQKAVAAAKLPAETRAYFEKYDGMNAAAKADAEIDSLKTGHSQLYEDLNKLRDSSSALSAGTSISRLYTHNNDRVMAYERTDGQDQFVVVTNFTGDVRQGYNFNLPPGKWTVVINTDDRKYGGADVGPHGTVDGGQGLTLPAGGTLILKRVE